MNRPRRVLLAALLPLTLAAPASAAAAAFGPAQTLDLPVGGPLAAAVEPGGAAVVAGLLSDSPAQARIEVAARSAPGLPWRIAGFGTSAVAARDLQVVMALIATVVAWSERRRHSQAVVLATADAGGRLTVRERLPVADALAAFPRLAPLGSGGVALAWRDGRRGAGVRARVRIASFDGERFTSGPRTIGTDVAQVAMTARGAGAAIGWVSSHRSRPRRTRLSVPRAFPRTLTVVTLDGAGLPSRAPLIAGRDVGATARLAAAPDGRLIAAWLRPQKIKPFPGEDKGFGPPPDAYVQQRAFTRQLLPRERPARPIDVPTVTVPGATLGIAVSVPSVAFDAPGHAVAALSATSLRQPVAPAYDALIAASSAGGPWSTPQPVAQLGFSRMVPVVVAPSTGPVVVYSTLIAQVGPARWSVAASDAAGPQVLGQTSAGDGRGVAVARGGDRVLVAWPSATGGVQVAEHG